MVKDYKDIDDIDKNKKKKIVSEFREDFNNIMNGLITDFDDIMKRRKIEKEKKEKDKPINIYNIIFNLILWVSLILLILNLYLFNVWLLKFFIKSIFGF